MAGNRRLHQGRGDPPHFEWPRPPRARQIPDRQGFALGQGITHGTDGPARRRYRTNALDENVVHDHLRRTRLALAPPNPKELFKAYSKGAAVGCCTSENWAN